MVGEGVLMECLSSSQISEVLSVSRKPGGVSHPKLKEYVVPDFLGLKEILAGQNLQMTFIYVSGAGTDSTEKGRSMWARVKGRTENALMRLAFRKVHNFRPGVMKPVAGQKHTLAAYKYVGWMFPFIKLVFPNTASTLSQVAHAMIICATTNVDKPIMEVSDINRLAPAD